MDELKSGPLIIGKVSFGPRPSFFNWINDEQPFGGFPSYDKPCPVPKQVDVGEMNKQYETKRIIVDKRTHRIRFEDESEHQVTVVIEPKGWLETPK